MSDFFYFTFICNHIGQWSDPIMLESTSHFFIFGSNFCEAKK